MTHQICTTAYKFSELSESAKERAREKGREWAFSEEVDWEYVFDDAVTVAALLGIEINTHSIKLMGGGTRQKPTIYFSGFCSQGDGACFEGWYRYKAGSVKAIKSYAPQDKTLHEIAVALQEVQRRNFYRLYAAVSHRGHYNHSGCTSIDVADNDNEYRDLKGDDEVVAQLLRDFMDWIYERLEKEHDYRTSDEAVDETFIINEYDFTEEGKLI